MASRVSVATVIVLLGGLLNRAAGAETRPDEEAARLIRVVEDAQQPTEARIQACERLREMKAKAAAPALLRVIPQLGEPAFGALYDIGVNDELLPVLLELLDHRDETMRVRAAALIGRLGAKGKPAVPKLIKMLKTRRSGIAAEAIGGIGPEAAEAAPALIALLQPQCLDLGSVTRALDKIAPKDERVVRALVTLLDSRETLDRLTVIQALARRGADAASALPALRRMGRDGYDRQTKDEADRALKAIIAAGGNKADVAAIDRADVDESIKTFQDVRRASADRVAAIQDLSLHAEAAQKLVPILSKCASDAREQADVRVAAVRGLARFGSRAVPALARIMRSQERDLRGEAASALVQIAPEGVKSLVDALKDPNQQVRDSAVQALLQTATVPGKTLLPQLLEIAKDRSPAMRATALKLLPAYARGQQDAAVADVCVRAMKDTDPEVRATARSAFASLDPGDDSLLKKAATMLKDANADIRLAAVGVFARQAGRSGSYGPRLIEIARTDPDRGVRVAAEDAILRLRPEEHAQLLTERRVRDLSDPAASTAQRVEAMNSLANLPAVPVAAIPKLIAILKHKDPALRAMAAEILGDQGAAAKSAADALAQLCRDADPKVRLSAEKAVSRVGVLGDVPVKGLIAQLASPDANARKAAARFLGRGGAVSAPAMEALAKLAREDPGVRDEAVEALRWIEDGLSAAGGPRQFKRTVTDESAALKSARAEDRELAVMYLRSYSREQAETRLKLIAQSLQDKQSRVRRAAAVAIRPFRGQANAAVPRLIALLDDWEPGVRDAAFEALAEIAPEDERVIASMISQLKSPYPDNRRTAAWLLGTSGAKGKPALSALRQVAASDADTAIRKAAADAISKIEKAD